MENFSISEFAASQENILVSATMYLLPHITEFRNGPQTMETAEKIGRKIVGELAYGAILIAALIETLFRTVLGLILFTVSLALSDESSYNESLRTYTSLTLGGALLSLESLLLSEALLIKNISKEIIFIDNAFKENIPGFFRSLNEDVLEGL
jgi:hypothetical protein